MARTIPLAANNVYLFYSVARDGVGHEELPSLAPDATLRIVPGDINSDGAINIHDLNRNRNSFGQRGNHILGDAADDGDVDIGDLYNVRNYLGATAPSIRGSHGIAIPSRIASQLQANRSTVQWAAFGNASNATSIAPKTADVVDEIVGAPLPAPMHDAADELLQVTASEWSESHVTSWPFDKLRRPADLGTARDYVFNVFCHRDERAPRANRATAANRTRFVPHGNL